MNAARKLNLLTVEEYLKAELDSQVKHEYLGGVIYAMAGTNNVHNLIVSNALVALGARLRGGHSTPTSRFASGCLSRFAFIIPTPLWFADSTRRANPIRMSRL